MVINLLCFEVDASLIYNVCYLYAICTPRCIRSGVVIFQCVFFCLFFFWLFFCFVFDLFFITSSEEEQSLVMYHNTFQGVLDVPRDLMNPKPRFA